MKEFSILERQKIPRTSGIYFLFNNKELLYIGKAIKLRYRINQHYNENRLNRQNPYKLRIDFGFHFINRILVEEMPYYLTLSMEYLLVQKFKPKLNHQTRSNHQIDNEMSQLRNHKLYDLHDFFKNS